MNYLCRDENCTSRCLLALSGMLLCEVKVKEYMNEVWEERERERSRLTGVTEGDVPCVGYVNPLKSEC